MIEIKDLRFSAPADDEGGELHDIVKGMDYTFEKGKFYGITGPNGSGKTTLAKLIMGINQPTGGTIRFQGEDISRLPITDRANMGIAYSFQHAARFKGLTFRDLLSIAAGTDDEDELVKIIARVGICSTDFLDKPVDAKLSGGEIKKIELATTIARNPKVAIYDEPDTGIDLWTIGPMVDLLKKEQREYGTTTLVVSHNRSFLETADAVLLIKDGRIGYSGDFEGAVPILTDLSVCGFTDSCEGVTDVKCYR